MVVFFNKVNPKFQEKTKSRQKTGLDVCLDMISIKTGIKHIHIVNSTDDIVGFLKKNKVRIAIFEALNFNPIFINQIRDMFGIKAYVHVHSSYPFLSQEPISSRYIRDCELFKIGIIFNSQNALNCYQSENNTFLENIYNFEPQSPKIFKGNTINIGCHGSLRHMKNVPLQAIAAMGFANKNNLKLRFHINSTRDDGESSAVIQNIRHIFYNSGHEIVNIDWLNHESFKAYCFKEIDLGLQVSLSETFNIVSADYCSMGIPIVVSSEVKWCDKMSVSEYSDINKIIDKMEFSLNNPVLVKRNQELLLAHSERATSSWLKFLGE